MIIRSLIVSDITVTEIDAEKSAYPEKNQSVLSK
jgi:hypothetical protein